METVEAIAGRIAAGHAFDGHVVDKREFQNERYGPSMPIETREEFKQHLVRVLESTETLCFTSESNQADFFYHPATNTLVVLPSDPHAHPTAYRPDDGLEKFEHKVASSRALEKRDDIPIMNSIYELRPDLAAAREVLRTAEEDKKLRDAIEKRFIEERNRKLAQHERELKHSNDPEAARLRHAGELRSLEAQKEQDFERYRREREDGRRMSLERERERSQQPNIDGPVLGKGRTR